MAGFSLANYDFIGFDVDHTLLRYNLETSIDFLTDFFVRLLTVKLGFECPKPKPEFVRAFLQRGLFVDAARGNFLKVGANYEILRATHGTRVLNRTQIEETYGPNPVWIKAKEFLEAKSKRACYSVGNISFTDFFTSPLYPIGALLVDLYDSKDQKYDFWRPLALSASTLVTHDELIKTDFYESYRNRFDEIIDTRSFARIDLFARELREKAGKKTFLVTAGTSAHSAYVNAAMFGPGWAERFDLIVNSASKPDFFAPGYDKPFRTDKEEQIGSPKESGIYSIGNYCGLRDFFRCQQRTGRFVYFGDDPYGDILGAATNEGCDAVAIIEECDGDYATTETWGSFLVDVAGEGGKEVRTLWGRVLDEKARLVVPRLELLLDRPWNHLF